MKKNLLNMAVSSALLFSGAAFAEAPKDSLNIGNIVADAGSTVLANAEKATNLVDSAAKQASDAVIPPVSDAVAYGLKIRAQSASRMFSYVDFGGVYHGYEDSLAGMDSTVGVDLQLSIKPHQTDYFFGRLGYENSFDLTDLFDAGRSSFQLGLGATYPVNATFFPYGTADFVWEETTACASSCSSYSNDGLDLSAGMKYLMATDFAVDFALISSHRDSSETGWRIGFDRFMHDFKDSGMYANYTSLGDSKIEFGWRMRR